MVFEKFSILYIMENFDNKILPIELMQTPTKNTRKPHKINTKKTPSKKRCSRGKHRNTTSKRCRKIHKL